MTVSSGVYVEDGGAARFVELTRRNLKEAAVRGSGHVGLELIPLGNDRGPSGQHPLQMISLWSNSWSNCCCWCSHADTAWCWGTSAWCGCRWPTGASQGMREVNTIGARSVAALIDTSGKAATVSCR